MTSFVAMRMAGAAPSEIRRMTRECRLSDGLNLGEGLFEIPPPKAMREAAADALEKNRNALTPANGARGLRKAIAAKVKRDSHLQAHPDRNVVVTAGATGGFAAAVNALLDPGDGILLLEPHNGHHAAIATVAGLEPSFATLEPPDFALTADRLTDALTDSTAALVIATPANPTGKVFSEEELEVVAGVAEENGLLVIADESFEHLIYDDELHISPASILGLTERCVSVMSASATFGVSGWRIGWVIAPPEMAEAIGLVNDAYYSCAPTPFQAALLAGLGAPEEWFKKVGAAYQKRRDILLEGLANSALTAIKPAGGPYLFADVSRLGFRSSIDAANALLAEEGVASIPGSVFARGELGEQHLRFCFAQPESVLEDAAGRIQRFRN